jgi:hypothetical protein
MTSAYIVGGLMIAAAIVVVLAGLRRRGRDDRRIPGQLTPGTRVVMAGVGTLLGGVIILVTAPLWPVSTSWGL